jgi:predicted small lipoprotein YifL
VDCKRQSSGGRRGDEPGNKGEGEEDNAMTEILAHCPFCDAPPDMLSLKQVGTCETELEQSCDSKCAAFAVACTDCGAKGPVDFAEDGVAEDEARASAVRCWNSRTIKRAFS